MTRKKSSDSFTGAVDSRGASQVLLDLLAGVDEAKAQEMVDLIAFIKQNSWWEDSDPSDIVAVGLRLIKKEVQSLIRMERRALRN